MSAIADHLIERGMIDEPIVAAGQLRQGKAPSMLGLLSGTALIEILRPKRSKLLPRNFVLAVTPTRVVAFAAWGGGDGDDYEIGVRDGIRAEFPRAAVSLHDLPDGVDSRGGTLQIGAERFPVARPNLNGDLDTDALIAALAA